MKPRVRACALTLTLLSGAGLLPVLVAIVPGATLVACGGGEKPPEAPPPPTASAATSAAEGPAASPSAAPAASAAPSDTGSAAAATPPPNPGSKKATPKTEGSWATCHQSYVAKNKDVGMDVAAMAKGCAAATKMKLVGKTLTGKQSSEDPPQSFPLKAEAKHCYRVYGQAAEGIKDLDVAIKDSAGAIAGEDSTDDPSPVVLEDGAVCFTESDSATVVVSVGMGKGAYAVQIWSD
jgi:hypothetical protein